MKKIPLFPLAIATALLACLLGTCKKNGPTQVTGYNISFTLNDTAYVYTIDPGAYSDTAFGQTQKGVSALSADSIIYISMQVTTTGPVEAGVTYTDTTAHGYAQINVAHQPGFVSNVSYHSSYLASPQVKITFTQITPVYVKGGFSGYLSSFPSQPPYSINGTFYVPVK